MNAFISSYILIILIVGNINISSALECYVCERQESNNEKCGSTMQTCQTEQDVCLTEISWGSTPYWTEGAKKQYYISKMCATKAQCHQKRSASMIHCTHIWYEDWRCFDCCRGDRCNYYIFSNSGRNAVSKILVGITILLTFFIHHS
ncbi:UPAR/Ly6 domain-containing protein cold [Onthophagus taurus]|uniref:UPAR/Ly6 domain-containing protein cold n=1 Tax=Onthophagus taurus TaxID=166361 RepID=UPI0039BE80BA